MLALAAGAARAAPALLWFDGGRPNGEARQAVASLSAEYLNAVLHGGWRIRQRPAPRLFERDHVSPWTSVYKVQRLVSAPVSFLLTSGGHNVGIVNPAAGPRVHPQASYRFAAHAHGAAPADPQAWQAAAPSFEGSWWPRWQQWLHDHSSGKVKAKPVAGGMEAAPGT